MKITILALITLLLVTSPVDSKSIIREMQVGSSVELEDQNLSLLKLDRKDDKVILCINGEKTIAAEDKVKTVNNVIIDVKDVKEKNSTQQNNSKPIYHNSSNNKRNRSKHKSPCF